VRKSEMIQTIASELIHEHTNFMPWDKAQEMAEIILTSVEKKGMRRPLHYIKMEDDLLGLIDVAVDYWEKE